MTEPELGFAYLPWSLNVSVCNKSINDPRVLHRLLPFVIFSQDPRISQDIVKTGGNDARYSSRFLNDLFQGKCLIYFFKISH